VDVLALTDHDTLAGIDEATDAIRGTGITLVPGIELSAQVIDPMPGAIPRSVHVLGLLVDASNPELGAEMARIRDHRADRLRLMVEKLAVDFDISWDEVQGAMAAGATPGRPHIAQILIAKGYFKDTAAAFATTLRDDGPYHVPHYAPRLLRALEIITGAGGVAILAHPATGARSGAVDHTAPHSDVIAAYQIYVETGLAGLEIDHRENTEEGKEVLRGVARELGMLVTGSSDYHGDRKGNRLGENTTSDDNYEAIVARATGASPISS
jgi:predicted metal-dependent phosphoesterase TrpH